MIKNYKLDVSIKKRHREVAVLGRSWNLKREPVSRLRLVLISLIVSVIAACGDNDTNTGADGSTTETSTTEPAADTGNSELVVNSITGINLVRDGEIDDNLILKFTNVRLSQEQGVISKSSSELRGFVDFEVDPDWWEEGQVCIFLESSIRSKDENDFILSDRPGGSARPLLIEAVNGKGTAVLSYDLRNEIEADPDFYNELTVVIGCGVGGSGLDLVFDVSNKSLGLTLVE